jgi:hypothetical protein
MSLDEFKSIHQMLCGEEEDFNLAFSNIKNLYLSKEVLYLIYRIAPKRYHKKITFYDSDIPLSISKDLQEIVTYVNNQIHK